MIDPQSTTVAGLTISGPVRDDISSATPEAASMFGNIAEISPASHSEQDVQADALALRHLMGPHGSLWIIERVVELHRRGDKAGVRRLRRIAAEYEKLAA